MPEYDDAPAQEPAPAAGHGMSVGRLEAFSDGVFAIVITLHVLDLPGPPASGSYAKTLGDHWATYVAYLASFFVAGTIWLNHHATFRLVLTVVIYGVTMTLVAFGFHAVWRYLLNHPELHHPWVSRELLTTRNRRYNIGLPIYPAVTVIGWTRSRPGVCLPTVYELLTDLPATHTRANRYQVRGQFTPDFGQAAIEARSREGRGPGRNSMESPNSCHR
jgi:hypothetical protein